MRRHPNAVRIRIGRNLKRLRLARRWSQAALAERLDFTEKEIGRIERAQAGTTVDRLTTLADALQCDVVEFFAPATPGHATHALHPSDLQRLEERLKDALSIVEATRAAGPLA